MANNVYTRLISDSAKASLNEGEACILSRKTSAKYRSLSKEASEALAKMNGVKQNPYMYPALTEAEKRALDSYIASAEAESAVYDKTASDIDKGARLTFFGKIKHEEVPYAVGNKTLYEKVSYYEGGVLNSLGIYSVLQGLKAQDIDIRTKNALQLLDNCSVTTETLKPNQVKAYTNRIVTAVGRAYNRKELETKETKDKNAVELIFREFTAVCREGKTDLLFATTDTENDVVITVLKARKNNKEVVTGISFKKEHFDFPEVKATRNYENFMKSVIIRRTEEKKQKEAEEKKQKESLPETNHTEEELKHVEMKKEHFIDKK